MYLGIRKDLIIVTLPYIDRPLADHILISFLIESSRSVLAQLHDCTLISLWFKMTRGLFLSMFLQFLGSLKKL